MAHSSSVTNIEDIISELIALKFPSLLASTIASNIISLLKNRGITGTLSYLDAVGFAILAKLYPDDFRDKPNTWVSLNPQTKIPKFFGKIKFQDLSWNQWLMLAKLKRFVVSDQLTQNQINKCVDSVESEKVFSEHSKSNVLRALRRGATLKGCLYLQASEPRVKNASYPALLLDKLSSKMEIECFDVPKEDCHNIFGYVPKPIYGIKNLGEINHLAARRFYMDISSFSEHFPLMKWSNISWVFHPIGLSESFPSDTPLGVIPAMLSPLYNLRGSVPDLTMGTVHVTQEPGAKARFFASPKLLYQALLDPLYQFYSGLLSRVNQDCTLDQSKGADQCNKWLAQGKTLHSIDLQSATDNFPLWALHAMMHYQGVSPEDIMLFTHVSRGTWNLSEDICQQMESLGYPGKTKLTWKTGQPLGTKPSFVVFATCMHVLIQGICQSINVSEDCYVVLGDDVVISNDFVAKAFLSLLSDLQVPVSLDKSITSKNIAEFAGYWVDKELGKFRVGKFRPLSLKNLLSKASDDRYDLSLVCQNWVITLLDKISTSYWPYGLVRFDDQIMFDMDVVEKISLLLSVSQGFNKGFVRTRPEWIQILNLDMSFPTLFDAEKTFQIRSEINHQAFVQLQRMKSELPRPVTFNHVVMAGLDGFPVVPSISMGYDEEVGLPRHATHLSDFEIERNDYLWAHSAACSAIIFADRHTTAKDLILRFPCLSTYYFAVKHPSGAGDQVSRVDLLMSVVMNNPWFELPELVPSDLHSVIGLMKKVCGAKVILPTDDLLKRGIKGRFTYQAKC